MLITNATLPTAAQVDLLVQQGRIAAVGPKLAAPPGTEVHDARAGC